MHAMEIKESRQAARELLPRVEAFLDTLPINRDKLSVRVNRCDGPEGEERDDVYYIWIGIQAVARGHDAGRVINEVHASWRDDGWEVVRHRELANGGVNLAATEPETGNSYALDSGFEKGPDTYIVGFFNTPCYQSPSGDVQFGDIVHGLEGEML